MMESVIRLLLLKDYSIPRAALKILFVKYDKNLFVVLVLSIYPLPENFLVSKTLNYCFSGIKSFHRSVIFSTYL